MQRMHGVVQSKGGRVVVGALIQVYLTGTSTPVTIYADRAGTQEVTQLLSDNEGEWAFYAPNGRYDIKTVINGRVDGQLVDVLLHDPADVPDDGIDEAVLAEINAVKADIIALETDQSNLSSQVQEVDGKAKDFDNAHGTEVIKGNWADGRVAPVAELADDTGANMIGHGTTTVGATLNTHATSITELVEAVDAAEDTLIEVNNEFVAIAASGGSAKVGHIASGVGAVARTVQDKLREVVSVKDFGAKGDGTTDDTAAIQACINAHKRAYFPAGTYRVTASIVLPVDGELRGAGVRQTILKSEVIGGSLIKVSSPDGVQVGHIADLQLLGNGLTGASGNGHALNFIDPQFATGAYTPQAMIVERLWIRDFRGQDVRDNGTTNKIAAAGIICVEGLQNIFRDILVHTCGHGFYLERTQTNKISNCVAYTCDKYGVLCYQTVGTIIDKCDLVGNGETGTTDAGYPRSDWSMGNLLSCEDEGIVITQNKAKNTKGIAQVNLMASFGALVMGNWLRSDSDSTRSIVVNHAIRAYKCYGIQIRFNTFSHILAGGSMASAKAKRILLTTDAVSETYNAAIEHNIFQSQSGLLVEYNLCLEGSTNTCLYSNVSIINNRFGTPGSITTASTIDVDIIVRNCGFTNSRVTNNLHYAQTNVTRTRCISGEGLTSETRNIIQYNLFKTDGGTITTNYFGFLYPTYRIGTATYDPPSLAAGGVASTTVSVSNAIVGEPAQVYFSNALQGVVMTGWVSAAGVVTIQFYNPTAGAIDLASGTVGAIVARTSIAEA